MKKAWVGSGRLAFWLAWPLLFVYLFFSRRSRILVVVDQDVLVVKGWLSDGHWALPGGGVHLWEKPGLSAVRELREETGIVTTPGSLQFLYTNRAKNEHGLRFRRYVYLLELPKKPQISRQKLELTYAEWIKRQTLYDDPETARNIRAALDAWQQKG
jgi:8-oxo-dGTP pyrophosphatase MutT (NUDIX family)